MRNDLATVARIELAENLLALATDLSEAVMFMGERDQSLAHLTDADEHELIRILSVAVKLKTIAHDIRKDRVL